MIRFDQMMTGLRPSNLGADSPRGLRPASSFFIGLVLCGGFVAACAGTSEPDPDPAALAVVAKAQSLFEPLPASMPHPDGEATDAQVDLGRMLYYENRLSKSHEFSCNSCHMLDQFGVDNEATSPGHGGARGDRNSPTVYNAAMHVAQFWDGREPDVEAQAKGPILNPVEMASDSEEAVVAVLNSIPGYQTAFAKAFPAQADPVTYDNMANAIGAFERNLVTPGPFDRFLAGEWNALNETQRRGFETFVSLGCNTCHTGAALGGQLYRKLGFIFPYETEDIGREKITGQPSDRHVFKVPSLRNVVETGPWFHDGSIETLAEAIQIMGYHQAGQKLSDEQVADLEAFLGTLTGEANADYIAKPSLPASGPNTPGPAS